MKNILSLLKKSLIIFAAVNVLYLTPSSTAYGMDPKAKALGTVAAYGTIGGALLGAASLAFGTSGRAVAVGASLGLYAGLVFGSYVVVSHKMGRNRYGEPPPNEENYYPDSEGAYDKGDEGEGWFDWGGGDTGENRDDRTQRFDPLWLNNINLTQANLEGINTIGFEPNKEAQSYYFEVVRFSF